MRSASLRWKAWAKSEPTAPPLMMIGPLRGREDRCRTELALTPRAEAPPGALTATHLDELRTMKPALLRARDGGERGAEARTGPAAS